MGDAKAPFRHRRECVALREALAAAESRATRAEEALREGVRACEYVMAHSATMMEQYAAGRAAEIRDRLLPGLPDTPAETPCDDCVGTGTPVARPHTVHKWVQHRSFAERYYSDARDYVLSLETERDRLPAGMVACTCCGAPHDPAEWMCIDCQRSTPPPFATDTDAEARRLRDEVDEATRGVEGVGGTIRSAAAEARRVQPDVDDQGVPYCAAAECPSYDGGTCGVMGQGVSGVCVPAVRNLVHVRRERDDWKQKALASNREAWEAQQALAKLRVEAVSDAVQRLALVPAEAAPADPQLYEQVARLGSDLRRHDNRLLDLERRVERLERPEERGDG